MEDHLDDETFIRRQAGFHGNDLGIRGQFVVHVEDGCRLLSVFDGQDTLFFLTDWNEAQIDRVFQDGTSGFLNDTDTANFLLNSVLFYYVRKNQFISIVANMN